MLAEKFFSMWGAVYKNYEVRKKMKNAPEKYPKFPSNGFKNFGTYDATIEDNHLYRVADVCG